MISLIQHFEADFLWKVSLKILNSGIILKTFTHASVIFIHINYNMPKILTKKETKLTFDSVQCIFAFRFRGVQLIWNRNFHYLSLN